MHHGRHKHARLTPECNSVTYTAGNEDEPLGSNDELFVRRNSIKQSSPAPERILVRSQ